MFSMFWHELQKLDMFLSYFNGTKQWIRYHTARQMNMEVMFVQFDSECESSNMSIGRENKNHIIDE